MRKTTICKSIIFSLFILSTLTIEAQTEALTHKKMGLNYLDNGEIDSSLTELNAAQRMGLNDGEVLGGMALVYVQKNDIKQAIHYAKKARKDKLHPSANAWLAGVLAYEAKGKSRPMNQWIEKGLAAYPTDFLLLYHAGRLTIHTNETKGEDYLLRAVSSAPAYSPAHLLLGEQMYRKGENIKALLPLLYYLMLNHNTPESPDILAVIENMLNDWAGNSQNISKINKADSDLTTNFIPIQKEKGSDNYQWLTQQLTAFMESLQTAKINPSAALWSSYTDFFAKAAQMDFDEALTQHIIFSRNQADVLNWITQYPDQYQMMADWITVWEFGL
ncbi:tetratricopeptide repeat protein [Geofilum sp. OHC36d9]|uniref:tetratricopeptide repeat protein n=1 Tax=Geofilum sp. OHC36d9 TaxID=3458413 RepID=UPI004033E32F